MRILFVLPLVGCALAVPERERVVDPDKIDPQVRRLIEGNDPLPVILLGSTQLLETPSGFDEFCRSHRDDRRSVLRRQVVARLKEIAAREQKVILDRLKPADQAGLLSLWIVNAIALKLRPDEIRAAAALGEVSYIYSAEAIPAGRGKGRVSTLVDPVARPAFSLEGKKVPWNLEKIGARRTWEELGVTGEGTVVAILDGGVNYAHEDLRSNLWVNPRETANNGLDDDGNGCVDDLYGYDFAAASPEVIVGGRKQHGTWTAGIVAGDGTGGTVTGVAPRARLMILKAAGLTIPAAMAHQYALENGADVMSMSFSIPDLGNLRGFWRRFSEHAVCAGLVLAGGAGNFQQTARIPEQVQIPKDIPCVLAAGGVDPEMRIPAYCSLGPVEWGTVKFYGDHAMPRGLVKPDVCAFPGPGYPVLGTSGNSGYIDPNVSIQGNSFSGPHAAGAAALILGAAPELPAWRVKEVLEETARDLGEPGKDNRTGAGLIDAYAAVRSVLARPEGERVPGHP